MTAPSETNLGVPPVWDPDTSFQHSFENNESITLWDDYTDVTLESAGGAADGDEYACVPGGKSLAKYINNSAAFWVRFCFRVSATRDADQNIFVLGAGAVAPTVAQLQYAKATDQIKCSLTNKAWSRADTWQTVEYQVSVVDQMIYVWVDGTALGSAAIPDIADEILGLTFGGVAANTVIHIDAVKVSNSRPGLPGRVTPSAGAYTQEGDIELDGVPFNLLPGQYQEQDISGFAPRLGSGAPAYSDLSGFQHFLIPSLHHGIGQPDMVGAGEGDENRYLCGDGLDTTAQGSVRLANGVEDTDSVSNVTAYDVMPSGEIVGCNVGNKSVYGLKFGSAKSSASYKCLFWRDGATLGSASFTCTDGVRDVLYNGQYLFVTLGGTNVRMQKTADLSTFTNVGNDTLPPVDMGAMAVHDEFLWVADRKEPIVYRAGQTDASDLAKETVLGLGAHRIGPGSVPINSMCSFEGKLYVGRQDGLYAVTQDADYVYVQAVETFPESVFNCRSMVVHDGYLIYAVGSHIYRLGGTSTAGTGAKMDITPGPFSSGVPGLTVSWWDNFTVSGGYLFAVGYIRGVQAYILCYNGSGWHCLYTVNNIWGSANYPLGLEGASSSTDEAQLHWALCKPITGVGTFTESYASARLGVEAPRVPAYNQWGDVTTSWMSFGLPMVPKLFRLVRLDATGVDHNNYAVVTYYVHTGQEERTGTLGVLTQSDANFLFFPTGTWGTKLALNVKLMGPGTTTPVIRKIVIQYMDRPQAVWGYTMTLDLSSPARTNSGSSGSHTVASLKEHLRGCREKASYVRFVDVDGNEADVFVSSGPRFALVQDKDTAQISLMVVQRYLNTPGTVGVNAS